MTEEQYSQMMKKLNYANSNLQGIFGLLFVIAALIALKLFFLH